MTPRLLETLIRLSTAHAKSRLSTSIDKEDVEQANEILEYAFNQDSAQEKKRDDMERAQKRRMKNNANERNDDSSNDDDDEDDEDDVNDVPIAVEGRKTATLVPFSNVDLKPILNLLVQEANAMILF